SLAGGFPGRSLAGGLLGRSLARGLLGRSFGRLSCGRFLRGSLACARRNTTFHSRSFRRELLCPRDNRFKLSARPEGRDGRRLHFHRLAGAGIAGHPCRATPLFEHTETGNGDAVTLVHRAHNSVDDVLDGGGCLPTVRAQFLCEHIYELCFVHPNPPSQWSSFRNRLADTVNPYPLDFQEPRAISVPSNLNFRNPVAALDRW